MSFWGLFVFHPRPRGLSRIGVLMGSLIGKSAGDVPPVLGELFLMGLTVMVLAGASFQRSCS